MRKKRILFATSYNANDTTSWLRAYGPLTLPGMEDVCEIVEPRDTTIYSNASKKVMPWWNNWRNWVGVDVCFLHRPYGKAAASIISNAQMHGVPIWCDHDDDLLAIPDTNPYKQPHAEAEKEFPGVEMSYRDADILTCSSIAMLTELKTKYGRDDAQLITSGLDDRFLRFKKPFSKNNRVGWRGSDSHRADILHFEKDYRHMFETYPEIDWWWFGMDPREIFGKDLDINGEVLRQLNMFHFTHELCKTNCSIHLVPLEPCHFNHVKSNLAWLDATLAGSAVFGPNDFPEWQKPGMLKWSQLEMLFENMDDMWEFLKEHHDKSWEYIQSELLTSKLNLQRIEILRNL